MAQIPVLHVGGYYDQEDLNGPQIMYNHLEKTDSFHRNYIVLGPWKHGQWELNRADSLGKIDFEINTNDWFQNLQKRWFDYWLKGKGDGKFFEANCFQTGSNIWKTYDHWPPTNTVVERLYAVPDRSTSFEKPNAGNGGFVSFISDPAKPVPYRTLPIDKNDLTAEADGVPGRSKISGFVSTRPDVISFTGDSLKNASDAP